LIAACACALIRGQGDIWLGGAMSLKNPNPIDQHVGTRVGMRRLMRVFKDLRRKFLKDRAKSSLAQVASAFIAAVGLAGIFLQIRAGQLQQNIAQEQIIAGQKSARENSAKQIYVTYMTSGFQNPEFTDPQYDEIKKNRLLLLKYQWFVENMLFAYDEIFDNLDRPEWVLSFNLDLDTHMRVICDMGHENPQLLLQFYKKTQALIQRAVLASKETECERFASDKSK
jgi:hypothetical protein